MTTLRAKFDGKVLVPLTPVDLPRDRVLEVHVDDQPEAPSGSPAAILKMMRSLPRLEPGDIEALERAIEGRGGA